MNNWDTENPASPQFDPLAQIRENLRRIRAKFDERNRARREAELR